MITVLGLPYLVGIRYASRNILQIFPKYRPLGREITWYIAAWNLINFLKTVNILLGYTGGRKTTENFCTWILFLTLLSFSFIKNSRDYPFQNVFLSDHKGQANVYLMMVKTRVN